MCGIAGSFGTNEDHAAVAGIIAIQTHRGPDARGIYADPMKRGALGHNRLSIVDLSSAGRQPMSSSSGRYWISFNGEIYNHIELRKELEGYPFRTRTDTEVILAAWERWGESALDRFIGMFAFLIWDEREKALVGVRDRFGVKPFFYANPGGSGLIVASEIAALQAIGIGLSPSENTWATYFKYGLHDHSGKTFWDGVESLPAGHLLRWQNGFFQTHCWYDVAERSGPDIDQRPIETVSEEYEHLMRESVRLRFRADVKLGVAISGGLDSSALVGLVRRMEGPDSEVQAYTYVCGDERYDELPWVRSMLEKTSQPLVIVSLTADSIPELAAATQEHESEPFGGIPTLAYSRIFESAREMGCFVLLDGQGMDEQWAGYDYYEQAAMGPATGPVQGSARPCYGAGYLNAEFANRAQELIPPCPFPDSLRNLQYRDIRFTKLPRALRFNDRISMQFSTELRGPFLDHRMFELALRQPPEFKIACGQRKYLLRRITRTLLPEKVSEAPKRPVQTPQREWLAGPLKGWALENIELGLKEFGGEWLNPPKVRAAWEEFSKGGMDNSFFVWQWISLGLMVASRRSVQSRLAKGAVN